MDFNITEPTVGKLIPESAKWLFVYIAAFFACETVVIGFITCN